MSPFSLPFMQTALAASLFAGLSLGILGVFVVTRRVSFSGLAVSQLAALGTVVGVSLGLNLHAGLAFLFVAGGMAVLSRLSRVKKIPQDSWVGGLYILGASLSVLILAKAPRGETETLGIFFGNVLSLTPAEVYEGLGLFAVTVLTMRLWYYRWVWLSFDAVSAEVAGVRVEMWNVFFYALFTAAMTLSIHICGVLLAFAFLLLPASAALLLVRRMRPLFAFVVFVVLAATVGGFYFSFKWDFPTGPFVAAVLASFLFLTQAYRGVVRSK